MEMPEIQPDAEIAAPASQAPQNIPSLWVFSNNQTFLSPQKTASAGLRSGKHERQLPYATSENLPITGFVSKF
ncbi:hypothetical protein [Roseobacter fucihabitans]|uniref:hypothetical protein n=1 Tax=Roseobacter fucihabitans TaxID=1537242 RepID=UPI001652CDD4|nr:hypothetical protein [Roseobacter litoralis]